MSSIGNPAQEEYARSLAGRAGFKTLEEAAEKYTGRPTVRFDVTPFTRQQASAVITELEKKLGIVRAPKVDAAAVAAAALGTASPAVVVEDRPKARYLTARHLRRIATHQEAPPAELDEDAKWVLAALARLSTIEYWVGRSPVFPVGVNAAGPIRTEHLIEFYGTAASASAAFGVSEKTFDGWGELVPEKHTCRAEVLTRGYVVAQKAL